MGWGLLLLPIAWIAMWLFGVNPATVGLLLLSAAVLIMAPGIAADLAAVLLILLGLYGLAAAFAVFKHGRQVAEIANAVSISAAPAGRQCGVDRRGPGPPGARVKEIFASPRASDLQRKGNVTAVPHPPKITGLPKPSPRRARPRAPTCTGSTWKRSPACTRWSSPGPRPASGPARGTPP